MQHMASTNAKYLHPLKIYTLFIHGYDSHFLDWAIRALDSKVTK